MRGQAPLFELRMRSRAPSIPSEMETWRGAKRFFAPLLMRKQVVYGPFALPLPNIRLLDLPGFGDANAVRNRVAALLQMAELPSAAIRNSDGPSMAELV